MSRKPETILRGRIKAALERGGAFATVIHGSMYQEAGLPDLCCVYQGLSFWIEVKRPGEQPRPAQRVMADRLRASGATVDVAHSISEALDIFAAVRAKAQRRVA